MKYANQMKRVAFLALLCALALFLPSCAQDYPMSYQRAINFFSAGEYEEAARAFERLGIYGNAPTYAAYSRGLVLFEQGAYEEAMPYFEKTQDFMYGKSRYTYCKAYTLEVAGSFAEAAQAFRSLGEFEDAASHAVYCQARAAEADADYDNALYTYETAGEYGDSADRLALLRGEMYSKAVDARFRAVTLHQNALRAADSGDHERAWLFDRNSNANYDIALDLFMQLGDFLDSARQASECKAIFKGQQYSQAERLEQNGQLQEAYRLFKALSGYNDADTRAQELGDRLGIVEEVEEEW